MVITDDQHETSVARDLLSRAREGNAEGFCLLLKPLQARLLRQAAALCGDLSTAEDLVSETLVEAWKSLPRYHETSRFSTWLYAILLHRYQKWVRRAHSRPISLSRLPFVQAQKMEERQQKIPAAELSPEDAAAQKETNSQLRRCVDSLPKKHREIILLRFFEEATLPDIAGLLGCSVGTVKSRLHHALEKLRKMKMNLAELKGDTQI
jgi:RNA polymerase sigma-70 factor (ECF subfamily)